MTNRFDKTNENQIAAELLPKVPGGFYQTFLDDPFAPFDRLLKHERGYIFVECRHRSNYTWASLTRLGGVRINSNKLNNVFLFVVRDCLGEIRVAVLSPERLAVLRCSKMDRMRDQGGTPQLGLDVPIEWFEKLEGWKLP